MQAALHVAAAPWRNALIGITHATAEEAAGCLLLLSAKNAQEV